MSNKNSIGDFFSKLTGDSPPEKKEKRGNRNYNEAEIQDVLKRVEELLREEKEGVLFGMFEHEKDSTTKGFVTVYATRNMDPLSIASGFLKASNYPGDLFVALEKMEGTGFSLTKKEIND